MSPLMQNVLAFVVFAFIAAILNAIVSPGYMEGPYAEGVGQAAGSWGLAYLITWAKKINRTSWLFGVSMGVLVLSIYIQPILM